MKRKMMLSLLVMACVLSAAARAQAPAIELTNSRYRLSDQERDLVERVVMAEARGEPYEGQMAVAQVIYNRIRDHSFPDTIEAVLTWEFAKPYGGKIFNSVKQAVHSVFDMGTQVVSSEILYFMNPTKASIRGAAWIRSNTQLACSIGKHEFYAEVKRRVE